VLKTTLLFEYHCIWQSTDKSGLVDRFAQLVEPVVRYGKPLVRDIQSILINHGLRNSISNDLIVISREDIRKFSNRNVMQLFCGHLIFEKVRSFMGYPSARLSNHNASTQLHRQL
jgi:hypothetical protein